MNKQKVILATIVAAAIVASLWHCISTSRECAKNGGVAVLGIGRVVCVAKL